MTEAVQPRNVLLLLADQLSASWLPLYGHPMVDAPSLDRLAADAAVFLNAYTSSPLCGPAYASLLTGRLPSRTGVYDDAAEMRPSLPTVAHQLRAAGYHTCAAGNLHFVGTDQLHGFEQRLTAEVGPVDVTQTPDWRLPAAEQLSRSHTAASGWRPGRRASSARQDHDDDVARQAVAKIRAYANDPTGQPFFLTVSFTHPRPPWQVRPEYWDRYRSGDVPAPITAPLPFDQVDPHSRRLRTVDADDGQLRSARHGYFAAVSYLDARVGELLDALDDTGLADDTCVVFTSDHGEMLGERGLWHGRSFYEPAVRVPLVIRAPRRTVHRRVHAPVSHLDLVPTVFDLAGVTPERLDVDGVTLAPLVDGVRADRGAPVVAEYLAEGTTAPVLLLRNGRFKLIRCPTDPDLLYDLAADPHELTDLSGTCGYTGTLDTLRAQVEGRWDLAALDNRVRSRQRDRLVVAAALRLQRV